MSLWVLRRGALMPPQPILPLEWEHLLNSNCPAGASSFSCLATSIPQGPFEGEQAHWMESLQESLWPFKEGLAFLFSLCRLALAMCLASSHHNSLIHSSCCLWGSIGCNCTLYPVNLFSHLQDFYIRDPKRVCM